MKKRIFAILLASQGSCGCGNMQAGTIVEINPEIKSTRGDNVPVCRVTPKEDYDTRLVANHKVLTHHLQIKKAERLFNKATQYDHAIYSE